MLASLVVVATPKVADAHTGSASVFYEFYGTLPGTGSHLGDPDLSYNPSTGATAFDLFHTGTDTGCPGTNTDRFHFVLKEVNANGSEGSGGVNGGGTSAQWGGTFGFCNTYQNPSGTSAGRLHNASTATTGYAGANLKVYQCVNGANLPCGTLVMEASTVATPTGPAPPELLEVVQTSAGGQTLTYDMVAALSLRAGWSKSQSKLATAIAFAESSFRTKAISWTGCCYGLWQINLDVWAVTELQAFSPYQATPQARKIQQAQGWDAWQAYSEDAHLPYMTLAGEAVTRQINNGQEAYAKVGSAPSSSLSTVSLLWQASPDGCPCTYHVERSLSSTTGFTEIGTTSNSVRTYIDNNAVADVNYFYRVKASNAIGTSEASNVVSVVAGSQDPDSGELPPDQDGPDGTGSEDPDNEGVSCGWNMFCWIKAALKWAFWPGEATTTAWSDFYDTIANRPPFNLGIGIVNGVIDFFDNFLWREGQTFACVPVPGPGPGVGFDMHEVCMAGAFQDLADPTSAHSTWLAIARWMMGAVIVIAAIMKIWRMLQSAFGRGSGDDLEEIASDVPDGDQR